MDVVEEYYGKGTFVLYALFANVPGKKAWPRKVFVTFSVLVLFLATVLQILTLVIEKFQRKVIIELLPTTVATAGILIYIPYVIFLTDQDYKALLSVVRKDLTQEKAKAEHEIQRQYAKNVHKFFNAYMIMFATVTCAILLSGFAPYFLDLLLPLNETRERRLLVRCDHFIDQRKFFYELYFFESSVVVIVAIVVGATEILAVIFVQHACSMGAVLGHRLENLTRVEDHQVLGKSDFMSLVTRRVYGCVEEHKRSLQFAALITDFFDIPLTLVLAGTFCALTVSLAQATNPQLTNTTIVFFTIVQVIQLFVLCYLGQIGIDSSKQVSVNAYYADWHNCSPNVRKLLQMIILRSSKACTMIVRGVYVLSMENFVTVMQTITSFYMVLRGT